jgi:hypothetical protein
MFLLHHGGVVQSHPDSSIGLKAETACVTQKARLAIPGAPLVSRSG